MNDAVYTPVARLLHWLMAAVIFAAVGIAFYADDLPEGPAHDAAIGLHIAVASTVLLWIALRLIWRVTHPAPPLPASIGPLTRGAAHGVHWLLYLLMIVTPLAGWLMVNAKGYVVKLGGVIPLPTLVAKSEALHEQLEGVHVTLGLTLAALAVGHALVALKHHFINRDDVLRRMLSPRR